VLLCNRSLSLEPCRVTLEICQGRDINHTCNRNRQGTFLASLNAHGHMKSTLNVWTCAQLGHQKSMYGNGSIEKELPIGHEIYLAEAHEAGPILLRCLTLAALVLFRAMTRRHSAALTHLCNLFIPTVAPWAPQVGLFSVAHHQHSLRHNSTDRNQP
jgi:hypothetical protein